MPKGYSNIYFQDREKVQVMQNWSSEEDAKLMKAIKNYGNDWKVIVSMFA